MLDFENVGKCSEGYMGAIKWEGNNSHKFLYGSELSAAVRKELKASGIKGVSVRAHTFSGGQELTVTIKTTAADYVNYEEFAKHVETTDIISGMNPWIKGLDGQDIYYEAFYELDAETQDAILDRNKRLLYDRMTHDRQMMQYDLRCSYAAKEELVGKLYAVNAIVKSFNYDDSNSMVDYFDTNFYYDIQFKRSDL